MFFKKLCIFLCPILIGPVNVATLEHQANLMFESFKA